MGFLARLFHKNTAEPQVTKNEFLFYIDDPTPEEISHCCIGDYVSFWVRPDNTNIIYIYRKGSVGGQGKIGFVPQKYTRQISSQLAKKLDYKTEITNISAGYSSCEIKCRLFSLEETRAKQSEIVISASERLRNELQKKYTPRQTTTLISIGLPKNHKLVEGQQIYLEKQTTDYYIQNANKLQLKFSDTKGTIVAVKNGEPDKIVSILRAQLSGHNIIFRIKAIKTLDIYTLKYVDAIEATAEVTYEKK